MIIKVGSEKEMINFGAKLGALLQGGEVIELVGDIGAGKTTLAKGIACGLGIDENVQSPSFTISQMYDGRDNLRMVHYDFYRLDKAGIMLEDISEATKQPDTITVIEWGQIISGILPGDRLTIVIKPTSDESRQLSVESGGPISRRIEAKL